MPPFSAVFPGISLKELTNVLSILLPDSFISAKVLSLNDSQRALDGKICDWNESLLFKIPEFFFKGENKHNTGTSSTDSAFSVDWIEDFSASFPWFLWLVGSWQDDSSSSKSFSLLEVLVGILLPVVPKMFASLLWLLSISCSLFCMLSCTTLLSNWISIPCWLFFTLASPDVLVLISPFIPQVLVMSPSLSEATILFSKATSQLGSVLFSSE